jgi:hypothetical protein
VIVGGGFGGIAAAKRYDIATPKSLNRPEMLSAIGRNEYVATSLVASLLVRGTDAAPSSFLLALCGIMIPQMAPIDRGSARLGSLPTFVAGGRRSQSRIRATHPKGA